MAPDIAEIDKPLGVRCPHLGDDCLCRIYETRPDVCRRYAADELCERIAAPELEQRVERYLAIFGLEEEAARVRASGVSSMRAARALDPAGAAPGGPRRLPIVT